MIKMLSTNHLQIIELVVRSGWQLLESQQVVSKLQGWLGGVQDADEGVDVDADELLQKKVKVAMSGWQVSLAQQVASELHG